MKSLKTVSQKRTSNYLKSAGVSERKIPKKIIPSKKRDTGICEICEDAPTCIYKRDLENPILNCAEFKAILPEKSICSVKSTSVKKNGYADNTDDTEYRGLCVNCEHRKICIYPKPEGGVWSCEEYE
ncbi:MAG: hypothetical protein JSV25_12375 [Spirochaetota bacterium]|nr:MAG: hypothetical protein JSV25_12375 [Spirochaetota bacterium]